MRALSPAQSQSRRLAAYTERFVAPSRLGRSMVVRVPGRRLGQSIFDDIGTLFDPTPGGGSATTSAGTMYVNAEGQDSSTADPSAGSDNPLVELANDVAPGATTAVSQAAAAAAQWFQQVPSWVWWTAGGLAGFALLSLTTGFKPLSWLNKNPRGRRRRRRLGVNPRRRRRSRRR